MAHDAQRQFCLRVKRDFPAYFRDVLVLDVGSLDVNGSNRDLFEESDYVGLDVGAGRNVDVVCPVHRYRVTDGSFDVVVSTECFEHDMYFEASLRRITELLRPRGLFFFTAAGEGRPEHGTRRTTPGDSPLTVEMGSWGDYYENVTESRVRKAIDIEATFAFFAFDYSPGDIYFWGMKRE